MPIRVDLYNPEITRAIENLQKNKKTIILRRMIEQEVESNREQYPLLGKLTGDPLKLAITASVNRRNDAMVHGKRPLSWVFQLSPSMRGVLV